MMTIEQLEWMALAAYDNLDSERLAAAEYGISVAAELCESIDRIGGYCPMVEKMLAEKRDQYINDVMEILR